MPFLNETSSKLHALSKTACRAAAALDFWRRGDEYSAEDVEKLLREELEMLETDPQSASPRLMFVVAEACQRWSGKEIKTIYEVSLEVTEIRKRIWAARHEGPKAKPDETATLRDFCVKLSEVALAHT